jgi:hypothetical protein
MPPAFAQLKTDPNTYGLQPALVRVPTRLTNSCGMFILTGVGGSQAINKESEAKLL